LRTSRLETVKARDPDRRGVAAMHDALAAFLRENQLGPRSRHQPVFDAWNQALGADLARRARPVRFARGELAIEVESAAHLHELANFTGENHRARANEILGKPEIRRVVFRLKR
jgi:hypothetical protein